MKTKQPCCIILKARCSLWFPPQKKNHLKSLVSNEITFGKAIHAVRHLYEYAMRTTTSYFCIFYKYHISFLWYTMCFTRAKLEWNYFFAFPMRIDRFHSLRIVVLFLFLVLDLIVKFIKIIIQFKIPEKAKYKIVPVMWFGPVSIN